MNAASARPATLVLGGCGFIGSHVVVALAAAGQPQVVLDRRARADHDRPGLRHITGEFGNQGDLDTAFDTGPIDSVVHLVSSTVPGSSNRDPRFDIVSNVGDSVGLLERCVRHGVRKVLYLSSGGAVYGVPQQLPVAEDHPTLPISSYGIGKLAVEKYLHLFHHLHGLQYSVIRAANPYGPGQSAVAEQGVVGVFAHRVLHGEELVVWGDGNVVRDYFHVRDLAQLVVLALQSGSNGVFNAGSGVGRSLMDVIGALERMAGRKARVRLVPGRSLDVPQIVLDCSRAEREFGWRAPTPFDEGLAEVRAWIEAGSGPVGLA
jgi:UDP-glucose 4-epimerase